MDHSSSSSSSKTSPSVRKLNDSVYEFHRPSGRPSMQVLFFHGLQLGHSYENAHVTTWQSGDESCIWPQSWLVEEFPSAHILTVSYHGDFEGGLRIRTEDGNIDYYIITENIMSDLRQANIGQEAGCPIILVGHSFGGLVIKALCWHAHFKGSTGSVKDANFMKHVKGLFFYSTPHQGITSKLAELFVSRRPLSGYVKTLTTEAPRMHAEFERLRRHYDTWQTAGLGENLPTTPRMHAKFERLRRHYDTWQTAGLGENLPPIVNLHEIPIVVEEANSRYGDDFELVQADHINVCRPMSKTSKEFDNLTKFLGKFLNETSQEDHPSPVYDDLKELCNDPITMDIMCDPVKCSDGTTYCRWTIIDNINEMRRSPYDRNMNLDISCDDITLRKLLFKVYPEQLSKFRERRKKHREEALQHACADPVELEDAIEKLNNVLKWDPRDTECQNELARVLDLVEHHSTQASLLNTIPEVRHEDVIGATVDNEPLLNTIPEVRHEDVIDAKLDNGGARLATIVVLFYIAIWFFLI